jgi:hypothetical protein
MDEQAITHVYPRVVDLSAFAGEVESVSGLQIVPGDKGSHIGLISRYAGKVNTKVAVDGLDEA